MSVDIRSQTDADISYPDSDGQPMADNTLQFEWIVTIKGNLDALFAERPDVFMAGDLLWYPVRGRPDIRRAPDAMVAFGRPKGYRGSYMQWREGDTAPQVVFEVLSPGNTPSEIAHKLVFYDIYGVEEYYLYDPDGNDLSGWLREQGRLQPIAPIADWVSPRLQIQFVLGPEQVRILHPDGRPFLTFVELQQQADQAEHARQQAEHARQQAEHARQQAEQRAEQLAARLRALGIEPDA